MDKIGGTQRTYQKIAKTYAQKAQNRDPMEADMARFIELVNPGGLVLDVGCGPGFDTAVLHAHNLHTIGLDYSMEMMQAGQQYQINIPLIRSDMRNLPFKPCADALWVSASLLHIPRKNVPATLNEFYRVLKPGGLLYLSVKAGDGEAWVARSHGHDAPRFFTYWQPQNLDTLLKVANFTLIDGWTDQTQNVDWLVRFAQKR